MPPRAMPISIGQRPPRRLPPRPTTTTATAALRLLELAAKRPPDACPQKCLDRAGRPRPAAAATLTALADSAWRCIARLSKVCSSGFRNRAVLGISRRGCRASPIARLSKVCCTGFRIGPMSSWLPSRRWVSCRSCRSPLVGRPGAPAIRTSSGLHDRAFRFASRLAGTGAFVVALLPRPLAPRPMARRRTSHPVSLSGRPRRRPL